MPKPVTTNEWIARAIAKVLGNENVSLEQLKRKVPKRFWDKVREHMGDNPPDKGTLSARWNRPSSGPEIRKQVESLLTVSGCDAGPASTPLHKPDVAEFDPRVVEPCADVETDASDYLDPSIVVDLNVEDLISLGVMTEPMEDYDSIDLEATDSVDLYGRNATCMVDTIDVETETWPTHATVISDETIEVVNQLEGRLRESLTNLAYDMESRVIRQIQTLVQDAVQDALARQRLFPEVPDQDGFSPEPGAGGSGQGTSVELRVRIDSHLSELLTAEGRSRHHVTMSDTINSILWQYFGKPLSDL